MTSRAKLSWKRGDLADRIGNHMSAEAIYQRTLADGTEQIIERIRPRGAETQDMRPFYRLVEVRDEKATIVAVFDYQREARDRADRRA